MLSQQHRVCTGSSIVWANWWPAVVIHLVCTQRPHPVTITGVNWTSSSFLTHSSFSAGYKKIRDPSSLLSFSSFADASYCSALPCYRHPQETSQDTQSLRSPCWQWHWGNLSLLGGSSSSEFDFTHPSHPIIKAEVALSQFFQYWNLLLRTWALRRQRS